MAAFTVGKGFRQIDKNSSNGNDKKMFFCQDLGGLTLMEFAKVAVCPGGGVMGGDLPMGSEVQR